MAVLPRDWKPSTAVSMIITSTKFAMKKTAVDASENYEKQSTS